MPSYDEAQKSFSGLLHWHLVNGTRPSGDKANGREWGNKEFAGVLKHGLTKRPSETGGRGATSLASLIISSGLFSAMKLPRNTPHGAPTFARHTPPLPIETRDHSGPTKKSRSVQHRAPNNQHQLRMTTILMTAS